MQRGVETRSSHLPTKLAFCLNALDTNGVLENSPDISLLLKGLLGLNNWVVFPQDPDL